MQLLQALVPVLLPEPLVVEAGGLGEALVLMRRDEELSGEAGQQPRVLEQVVLEPVRPAAAAVVSAVVCRLEAQAGSGSPPAP